MPANARSSRKGPGDELAEGETMGNTRNHKSSGSPAANLRRRKRKDEGAEPTSSKITKKRKKLETCNDDGFEFKLRKSKRISDRTSSVGITTETTTTAPLTPSASNAPTSEQSASKPKKTVKKRIKVAKKKPQSEQPLAVSERSKNRPHEETTEHGEPRPEPPNRDIVSTVFLHTSETPIQRKNQKYRQGGSRRSSIGNRGRRASSMMMDGIVVKPHPELSHTDFYKHIQADNLENLRMRQLMSWCAYRKLKDPKYTSDVKADAGAQNLAKVIGEDMLKDIAKDGALTTWFIRDDTTPTAPRKPNSRNEDNKAKLRALKDQLQKLDEECELWKSMRKLDLQSSLSVPLDFDIENRSLLPQREAEKAESLLRGSRDLIGGARKAARQQGADIEFQLDRLADGVHKIRQYSDAVDRFAGRILEASEETLANSEKALRQASGTEALPLHEVLRSLAQLDQ